jgi:hypothetical protein
LPLGNARIGEHRGHSFEIVELGSHQIARYSERRPLIQPMRRIGRCQRKKGYR